MLGGRQERLLLLRGTSTQMDAVMVVQVLGSDFVQKTRLNRKNKQKTKRRRMERKESLQVVPDRAVQGLCVRMKGAGCRGV